jgi:ABC-type bacteriocin/lantibiotic exporter with double-glycine peptidase domain
VPLLSLYAAAGIRLLPAAQQLYFSINNLTASYPQLQRIVSDLSEAVSTPKVNEKNKELPPPLVLQLNNVSFRYARAPINSLSNISISIQEGEKIGIVGQTGSGKSTLIALLLNLLTPTSGEVHSRDPQSGTTSRWAGYVPQNITFTDGTIAENIAFGLQVDRIDLEQVEKAAKAAQAWEFIKELDDGLNHKIGEDASRLSGGQRQRLGVARALYFEPQVLILDEASSALDAATEKSVYAPLFRSQHLTLIIISHRLEVLSECDMLYMLKDGRLVSSGNYCQLIQKDPSFRQLAAMQP